MKTLQIGRRTVGNGSATFIVAEMSANHNQDIDRAKAIIEAAARAGADAVKLQTYTPDSLTIDSDSPMFRVTTENSWSGKTLYNLYREAQTPWEWHATLKQVAHEHGLEFFSTPFDRSAVDFLAELGVPAYKIASFELVDHALLRYVASMGVPVVLSTGLASLTEVSEAVDVLRQNGDPPIALLHCVSAYPAPISDMNLATIPHLREVFDVVTGLSDHTRGDTAAVVAVAVGAKIVEKHLTLSRDDGGTDSFFSLEPAEFRRMVQAIREAEQVIGVATHSLSPSESRNLCFRRSLFAVRDIRAGDLFTDSNVRSIRPGGGLAPKFLPALLGRRARVDIPRGTPLEWHHV